MREPPHPGGIVAQIGIRCWRAFERVLDPLATATS